MTNRVLSLIIDDKAVVKAIAAKIVQEPVVQ